MSSLVFPQPVPLSLYVHFPWCIKKCPYCDFNSHTLRESLPEARYLDALIADLEQELPDVWGRSVETVFFGGGTPSLFSAAGLERFLSALRARLHLRPDIEITLEANPGTFEQARFADYRALGINRLSLGVQSFDAAALKRLGRVHDADEARRAAEQARAAGFENLNLDLMFALPGQSAAAAEADIRTAIALEPTHISYYQLTLEPNTLFYKQPPVLPADEQAWEFQQTGHALLAAAGYRQYEVSAFARADRQCLHNLNYWRFGDYLGIGAGAHGKLSLPASGRILRRHKQRQPEAYMHAATGAARILGEQALSPDAVSFEFMLNALRLSEGFEPRLFNLRTGLSLARIEPQLRAAEKRGLLRRTPERIAPTELGERFLNDLMALFLPDGDE